MARASGIPAQSLSNYWTGKTVVPFDRFFKITDALECNPRWLATGEGSPEPPPEIDPERRDEEGRLLDAWRRLEPGQQAHVIENAEMLLGMYRVPRMQLTRDEPMTLHDKGRGFKGEGE